MRHDSRRPASRPTLRVVRPEHARAPRTRQEALQQELIAAARSRARDLLEWAQKLEDIIDTT